MKQEDRLTERLTNGVIRRSAVTDDNRGESIISRLAQYEDIGTVEELSALKAENAALLGICEDMPQSTAIEKITALQAECEKWCNIATEQKKRLENAVNQLARMMTIKPETVLVWLTELEEKQTH